MSEESGKTEEIIEEIKSEESTALELGVLTGAILDYYETTGGAPLDSGEEWKKLDPEKYIPRGVDVPLDLDEEIKKAFMTQIKKFQ